VDTRKNILLDITDKNKSRKRNMEGGGKARGRRQVKIKDKCLLEVSSFTN